MGLDMYLYRKQYVQPGTEVKPGMSDEAESSALVMVNEATLVETIGYWRKANQIHRWFVENVQEGNDDCMEYDVSREQLGELLETVKEVIKSIRLVPGIVSVGQRPGEGEGFDGYREGFTVEDASVAEALLPVQEGFFFGSYLYDSWYFEGLVVTQEILERALHCYPDAWFTYQSSW